MANWRPGGDTLAWAIAAGHTNGLPLAALNWGPGGRRFGATRGPPVGRKTGHCPSHLPPDKVAVWRASRGAMRFGYSAFRRAPRPRWARGYAVLPRREAAEIIKYCRATPRVGAETQKNYVARNLRPQATSQRISSSALCRSWPSALGYRKAQRRYP